MEINQLHKYLTNVQDAQRSEKSALSRRKTYLKRLHSGILNNRIARNIEMDYNGEYTLNNMFKACYGDMIKKMVPTNKGIFANVKSFNMVGAELEIPVIKPKWRL
jgi:nitrogen fixation/metabolism regulation signal transduction histidine kinase